MLSPDQLVNTPPLAGPNTIERDPTGGVKVSVASLLGNDTDADFDPLSFAGANALSANGGTVVSNSGWIFYTPAAGFTNTDTFSYTNRDNFGAFAIGIVTVNVRTENGPSPNLTISALEDGSYRIRGDGIPDRVYRIEFSTQNPSTNWQSLGLAPADEYGVFILNDTNGSPQRFYRSVYP